ncbi:hypothetical protein BDV25DRAFT_112241 [Aspergillus avenaceus]|uniref:C2H2-type domain-containing protein n=1 Tax=Aspergillus avenaceus TaxID=36643 RepID=A0A5N6TCX9_ASPAV|nr:hypothetical protein BDV25DRAFT_112241 [Aspergillus avenaceus]
MSQPRAIMYHYSMAANIHACPPMEPSYSTSSDDSSQSSMGFLEPYHMASNDLELYSQASNTSAYSSSYPSSSYSSFSSSSFDSASMDSPMEYAPPMICAPEMNPQYAPQYFSSPVQTSWPTAQMTPVEEYTFPPLETHYTPCESAKPVKPYACHCGRAFTRPADLKRHQSSVHNPVFQDCPVSGCIRKDSNGFPRRDHLIEHLRSYHHLDVPKRRAAAKRVAKAS